MKYKLKITLTFVTLLFCVIGCSDSFLETTTDSVVIDNTPQLNVEQANQDFSKLPFKTGINDFELNVLFNKKWAFRLSIPLVEEDELIPLFVNLHGSALVPRADAHKRGDCLIGPALETADTKAYILSPNSQAFLWFDPFNETQVVNLVEFAIAHLNVDPKRVVAFGYSDGGFGSWFFADTHPELFSAAIPVAQAYGLITTDGGIIKKTEVPLFVIQGELDELFPFTNTETLVEQSRSAGSEIILVKAIGLSHNVPCSYLPYVEEAVEWLKTSVWQ
jgi:predicted peptidase